MRSRSAWILALPLVLTVTITSPTAANPASELTRIQSVVDQLRSGLSISVAVTATLVQSNPLVVSVEPQNDHVFLLAFEQGFADQLDDEELRAVVAHELGHVWIFTHHPYLQTERLANDIAMRVVSRQSLERVYTKVWAREGAKGDLARFLGQ
jgi:hypothetical protein